MRAAVLALAIAACVHAPPQQPRDVVACLAPRVSAALLVDVVGPALMGETNGAVTVDARGCGAPVLSEADAARLQVALVGATNAAAAVATLAGGDCVDEWAGFIGRIVGSVSASLPGALSGSGPARVEWDAPPACKP